ncbi:hypothetical protein LVJ83_00790 [Uruburuella testudinis]|uniref:BPL/LPL catalytic domain-containing protein n=1 Tax=Uruburuella testudinis TaxID=1282863 RepID=A0ABY4DWR4_9NEIS|nr:hypothetical protein [Uruburuella testudinis]UOO82047.1 hypothetical protein LVJ83_00790 [Uruburuella testudinis]
MPTILPPFTPMPENRFNLAERNWADNERAFLADIPAAGYGLALIHEGGEGVVVPRSYPQGKPAFQTACNTLAAEGLNVHVRLSGGGVVPQAAGVVNLHLGYLIDTPNPLLVAEAHYQALCALLTRLFEHFGIRTAAQTVQGSFCDGRYNLAADGKKIAGTAQHWQRDKSAENRYRVLSHAVILAADPQMLTARANRFEAALGSGVRYRADKTTSLSELAGAGGNDVIQTLQQLLAER